MTSGTRRLLIAVVIGSGLVRAAHLLTVQATPLFVAHRVWPETDMYLFDQWAQRILDGDPLGRARFHPILDWMLRTAPPASWARWFGDAPAYFKAPLYAYLVALLRSLFGDPALPMAILQIVASMSSAALLFLIAARLFGDAAGLLAALVFAVYGPAVHYDVVLLRGPWIVLASLLVTWRLMGLREHLTPWGAGILGLVVGVAILLNEGFASLPILALIALTCWAPSPARWAAAGAAFLAGLGVALAPLVVRNVAVGAPPLQVAVLGAWAVAFYNASDSDPFFFGYPKPSFAPLMEAGDGRLGRVAWLCLRSFDGVGQLLGFYLRRAAGLIAPFENADNASFYYATTVSPLLRWLPGYEWLFPLMALGLVLAAGRARFRPLATLVPVMLALLAANLLASPLSRYRLPLIVLAMPFAGLALERMWHWATQRRLGAVTAALSAMLGCWIVAEIVERRVVLADAAPWTHVYRLAEFEVAAKVYERDGRYREASEEFLALAAHVPRGSRQWVQALMLATPLQVRAGDPAGARATVDAAAELAPADPFVLLAIGDIYWHALGDPGTAGQAYRRAAELQPTGWILETVRARLGQLAGSAPVVTPPRDLGSRLPP